ncbi:sugar kinase [Haloplasma contractile]|uniref:Sugar kinase protein n=1 Tax=Haloplasma contractile SSD-17B TaxID=1033810 RepID=F7PVA1_9MOLU|nr:sugar kinase [Haloplasma contractile]ERJ12934.1 Sugar kinase protein [Haloplasma contractile SSD-17B]
MAKVVTMGEIMLRLKTPGHSRFVQTGSFEVIFGGSEANVAVALAHYGHQSYYVSKLPHHEIGQSAINHLRQYGVKHDYIVRGGNRIGIYFLEAGASMRPSKVIYDRAQSAIAEADVNDFDFDSIFKDADWFHFSGITPALCEKAVLLTEAALKAAKRHNVMVSVDINYRKSLWTIDEARETMIRFMQYVDYCIGGTELFFNTIHRKEELTVDDYKQMLKGIHDQFGFTNLVTTLRETQTASNHTIGALGYDGIDFYQSKDYTIQIVDRVGSGDAFAGGFIHGLLTKNNLQDALEFGIAAGALKHTVPGDFNLVSEEEINRLVEGDSSLRIQR